MEGGKGWGRGGLKEEEEEEEMEEGDRKREELKGEEERDIWTEDMEKVVLRWKKQEMFMRWNK